MKGAKPMRQKINTAFNLLRDEMKVINPSCDAIKELVIAIDSQQYNLAAVELSCLLSACDNEPLLYNMKMLVINLHNLIIDAIFQELTR